MENIAGHTAGTGGNVKEGINEPMKMHPTLVFVVVVFFSFSNLLTLG